MTPRGNTDNSSWSEHGHDKPLTAVIYLRVSTKEQAEKGGEAEGYSIPAQREACRGKAESLGAAIAAEFVDPGNSGRTANRPGLQALLAHIDENPTKYVIVHKLDRLARDMGVHTTLWKQLEVADSLLVSCTEPLDDSTSYGKYIRTLMAANATFYSDNLGDEVRKGMQQKVLMGGTPGYCRLGYLNTTTMVNGQPVKGIELDPERAPHLHWMFKVFESGEWSITDIVAELDRRGMRNRATATRPGKPLSRSQVHRILTNPYYIGKLPFKGVIYEGRHPPLIDERTFQRVQHVLSGRRIAGDRSWRHEHYLKGSLFCARCQSRLGFGVSRGKSGQLYPYFFCLGRHTKRTTCDLPYLPVDAMEEQVLKHWRELKVTSELIAHTRASVKQEMIEQHGSDKKLITTQTRRVQRLEDRRQKLIDAYLDGAITLADLKRRQTSLDAEQQEAKRFLSIATINTKLVEERLEIALRLLEHCERLYTEADDNSRRSLNKAFFAELQLDQGGIKHAILNSPFIELLDRTIGLRTNGDDPDSPDDGPETRPDRLTETSRRSVTGVLVSSQRPSRGRPTKNPEASRPRGSNVALLAERAGFEPATHVSAGTRFPVALLRPTRTPLLALLLCPHSFPTREALATGRRTGRHAAATSSARGRPCASHLADRRHGPPRRAQRLRRDRRDGPLAHDPHRGLVRLWRRSRDRGGGRRPVRDRHQSPDGAARRPRQPDRGVPDAPASHRTAVPRAGVLPRVDARLHRSLGCPSGHRVQGPRGRAALRGLLLLRGLDRVHLAARRRDRELERRSQRNDDRDADGVRPPHGLPVELRRLVRAAP